jgi:hypothetical protein
LREKKENKRRAREKKGSNQRLRTLTEKKQKKEIIEILKGH